MWKSSLSYLDLFTVKPPDSFLKKKNFHPLGAYKVREVHLVAAPGPFSHDLHRQLDVVVISLSFVTGLKHCIAFV